MHHLFSCSKNVQITFTAAKYIRGYYDYENKIDYSYTSFDPKNDGYEWIKGYYFDLDLKKGFSFNKPLEENVNVYYALIKCSI